MAQPVPATSAAKGVDVPPSPLRLRVAVGVAVVWWLALATAAVLTANPVTLNREQVGRSDLVVTASVVDAAAGTVEVERTWKGAAPGDRFGVDNLEETGVRTARRYVLPLIDRGGRYSVTRSSLPDRQPLVYPHSADLETRLTKLLEGSGATRRD